MKKIREEKGYTYGILSSLVPMTTTGYWMLATEVVAERTNEALVDIYHEITKMCDTPVPENELLTVKNYLIGQYAASFNNPMDLIEKHKSIVFEKLPALFYENYVPRLRAVTAADLQAACQTFWTEKNLIEIVVGP
jgi:zinc protease